MKNNIFPIALWLFIIGAFIQPVSAQFFPKKPVYDSAYIVAYPDKFAIRIRATQNHAAVRMSSKAAGEDIYYRSNRKAFLSLGGTYKNLALDIGVGVGYLNNDNKGKTKGIDFQLHFTPYKWEVDVFTGFHKGNHLTPKGYFAATPDDYYYRRDVKLHLVGIGVYRVANPKRFSPGAAFNQAVWQIKSAGTFLFGGEAFYSLLKGDSSLFPSQAVPEKEESNINRASFINIGPGVGYAYTLVISKHFFLSGSVIANANLNIATEKNSRQSKTETGFGASAAYRGAVGYNSATWGISANVLGNVLNSNAVYSSRDYLQHTGMYRIALVRKISLKKHSGT